MGEPVWIKGIHFHAYVPKTSKEQPVEADFNELNSIFNVLVNETCS